MPADGDIAAAIVDGVTRLANHKAIIAKVEPQVCFHEPVPSHVVRRVLYSLVLLFDQLGREPNER